MKTQEEIDIEIVSIRANALYEVKKQTPAIALAAVINDGNSLRFVQEKTEEIVLAAVRKNGRSIRFAENQTHEASIAAVSQCGEAIQFIKEITPEISLAAVKQDGRALEFIKNQTPEITLAAVLENPSALMYVNNETPDIAKAAILKDYSSIFLIKNQTPELCIYAVSKDGALLEHIRNQTPEISLAAVSQNGLAISFAKNIDEKLVLAAWKNVGDDLLNFSCKRELNKVIEILLNHQIDIEHISVNQPLTPFHCAVHYTNLGAMHLLHDSGANINAKIADGSNILSHFLECTYGLDPDVGMPVIINLLNMGANTKDVDKQGKTAMMLAENFPEVQEVMNAFEIKKLVESTIKNQKPTGLKKRNRL
jgi:ribosomal protein L24E